MIHRHAHCQPGKLIWLGELLSQSMSNVGLHLGIQGAEAIYETSTVR